MKNMVIKMLIFSMLLAVAGCTGSFNESGGTYSVSVPSSDSVSVQYTESGAAVQVVGGPIQSNIAVQK